MKYIKTLLAIFIFVTISIHSQATKNAYKIQITLNNSQDTSILLVSYYGNTNQIVDTAYLNKGSYTFEGTKPLNGGIYLVVFQNKQYFEMVVDKEPFFSLETDPSDPINKMKIKNSKDNEAFYNYLKEINVLGKSDQKLNQKYKELDGDTIQNEEVKQQKEEVKQQLEKINTDIKNAKLQFIENNQGSLFAKILQASKEPEVPKELPLNEDGSPDSTYIYTYYKEHFFDDFDFADERLLRTPIYANKIKKYFKSVLVQRPDTLIKEAFAIIEKAKPNKETYKFNIWYFTYEAETSQIMGMDEVFVALGKKYYLTGEAFWISDGVMKKMKKRILTLDKLLIGNKAPNLIMQDTLMQLRSLHDVNAKYTLVLFWDPDCGHCKSEIHELIKCYNSDAAKYNLKVFAVCSDTSVVKWEKKIHEYKIHSWMHVDGPRSLTENYHDLYDIISTPTIYLLDEKKNILAKRLNWKQTTDFVKRNFDLQQKEK